VRPYYNYFAAHSDIDGLGFVLPNMEVLGKLSAILAHSGCRFDVVDDGTAESWHRLVPTFKANHGEADSCPHLDFARQQELILGGPSVSVSFRHPINFETLEAVRVERRKFPSVVFQETEPLYLAYLDPVVEWELLPDGMPWPMGFKSVPCFSVSVFKDLPPEDQEAIKLFARLIYDTRVGIGLEFWALSLPFESFAQIHNEIRVYLLAGEFRNYRRAVVCLMPTMSLANPVGTVGKSVLRGFYGATSAIPSEGITPFNLAEYGLSLTW
jgi:hypothetical protein